MYHPIDQEKTGKKLKIMLKSAGYDVKYIQNYLKIQVYFSKILKKILPETERLILKH